MITPYYFADRNLKIGFNITLETHHINHDNSKLNIKANYPEFRIEVRCNNKILKELSINFARLLNQYKLKHQTVFSARFDKQDEDNRVLDETDLFLNLYINHNLTETDIDEIDMKSPLENHIPQQEMKDSGWRFNNINSVTI